MSSSTNLKHSRILNLIARIGLCTLTLILGTMVALLMGETEGLALADLSGTSVHAVAASAHSDVLYAGLTGGSQPAGIYRSDDNGRTWQLISSGPGPAINALAVHPVSDAVIYAGTAGGPAATTDSLWRSDDGGQTWHRFTMILPADPDDELPAVNTLAVDPDEPGVLYVGTDGHGVYRISDDNGDNSYKLVGGISLYYAHVNNVVVGPDNWLYALTDEGLFATGGDVWQELSLPEWAVSLAVAPDDPQTLYVGCVSTGAYRTTDGGQTWESINSGLETIPGAALRVTALAVDEEDSNHIVAATAYGVGEVAVQLVPRGIYESYDASRSWTQLAEADEVVTQLTVNQGVISATTANGLARYREPVRLAPAIAFPSLRSLTDPSGIQVLILILTIGLAGLALVGRDGVDAKAWSGPSIAGGQVQVIGGDKMRLIMKGLKLVGLGVAIWGLSLLWPEVNLVLAPPAMIGVVLRLGVVVLVAYALDQHLDQRHDQEHKAGQDHPPQPTPPTPAALTR